MAIIPERPNTLSKIIDSKSVLQTPRKYLGMSGFNDACSRKPWYNWRWFNTSIYISARINRIFRRGDLEEPRIISDLEAAGCIVSGEQYEIKHASGHSLGHIDGLVYRVPEAPKTLHLLEIKTMKSTIYNKLVKELGLVDNEQVLEVNHPTYFGQTQLYAYYMGLSRILFCATNKDNEERIYVRMKTIPEKATSLRDKLDKIIMSKVPPKRVSSNPKYYKCKLCDFSSVCHHDIAPPVNCRTCKQSRPVADGNWLCGNTGELLSIEKQRVGCADYTGYDN